MTHYRTVDVFAAAAFLGNPLAVIPDARALKPDDFQRIAREFNYSETTFVLPPESPENHARVRIFTPNEEMPFAGHPNVGTAYVLGRIGTLFGKPVPDAMRFEEIAGVVSVALMRSAGEVSGAAVRAPRALETAAERSAADVAALAGIAPSHVLSLAHLPLYAAVGAGFLFAEVTPDALAQAAPDTAAFHAEAARLAAEGASATLPALFLWAREGMTGAALALEARMFAPLSGISEDPATGSAAAALGALLARRNVAQSLAIRQGVRMGRPSQIGVEARPDGIWISGRCVPQFAGQLSW